MGNASILLVERFDRVGAQRVPYISAMTLLDRADGDDADYVEIAEAFAAHGAQVRLGLRELWRRIAFSLALNNTDDHLRNHGFLHGTGGWALAPVFDVNPNPEPAARATSIVGSVDRAEAQETWRRIVDVVSGWRSVATSNGIGAGEQRRFAAVLDGAAALGS